MCVCWYPVALILVCIADISRLHLKIDSVGGGCLCDVNIPLITYFAFFFRLILISTVVFFSRHFHFHLIFMCAGIFRFWCLIQFCMLIFYFVVSWCNMPACDFFAAVQYRCELSLLLLLMLTFCMWHGQMNVRDEWNESQSIDFTRHFFVFVTAAWQLIALQSVQI